jgi:hypothetical protein
METEAMIQEYAIGDNTVEMVVIAEDNEELFYSVRYLVCRKFGFKTFWKMSEAEQFYNQIKAQIVLEEIKKLVKTS